MPLIRPRTSSAAIRCRNRDRPGAELSFLASAQFCGTVLKLLILKNPLLLSPFIILVGLVPLAWVYRSRVLLATTIGAFMLMLAFSVVTVSGDLVFLLVFFSACILIAVGLLVRRRGGFPGSEPVFYFIGYSVYLVILFVLNLIFPVSAGSSSQRPPGRLKSAAWIGLSGLD